MDVVSKVVANRRFTIRGSVTNQWAREYWRGILSISALVKARNVCVRILPRMAAEQQYAGRRLIIRSKKTQIWSYWPSVQYIAHEGARSFHSGVAALAFHGVTSEAWRRGELNPCPRRYPRKHLHVYPAINSEEPSHAPAHCQLPSVHEIDSRTGAVAPPVRQPAVHVFAASRRHCENVTVN